VQGGNLLALRKGEWYGIIVADALITQLLATRLQSRVHRKWRKVRAATFPTFYLYNTADTGQV
jgi:hypothetical protein